MSISTKKIKKKKDNMYSEVKQKWNPYVGCMFDCVYCRNSFQRGMKRQKNRCTLCYEYTPHTHTNRLNDNMKRTDDDEFIAVGLSGDIAFCPLPFLTKVLDRIRTYPDRTFLIQSKDPDTFNRVKFPNNVLLGITLETDREDVYGEISRAPKLAQRVQDFAAIEHARKFITIEPIMTFNIKRLVSWILRINPEILWIGYDNHKNKLPEPELADVHKLIAELTVLDVDVRLKSIRERWDASTK